MHKKRFEELNKKFLNNTISEPELQEYLAVLDQHEDMFYEAIDQVEPIAMEHEFDQAEVFQSIVEHPDFKLTKKPILRVSTWISIAASMMVVFGISYFLMSRDSVSEQRVVMSKAGLKNNDDSVLYDSSVIKLADGTHLTMEDIDDNTVSYDGIALSKDADNMIKVVFNNGLQKTKKLFHEFRTPKGLSYTLLLPDGTKVYLNSSSTFKLAANFNESNRTSELSGEAFFDVAHQADKPFIVQTKDYAVQVLGTQFNLKSYPQSGFSKTSLLQGAVQVNAAEQQLLLVPGEQTNGREGGRLAKQKANFHEVLAWREGYFRFSNARLKDIMNDVVNWYDIQEVVYEDNIQEHFTGSIIRSRNLTDVLTALERISNLTFERKEGRIIVRN